MQDKNSHDHIKSLIMTMPGEQSGMDIERKNDIINLYSNDEEFVKCVKKIKSTDSDAFGLAELVERRLRLDGVKFSMRDATDISYEIYLRNS